MRLAAALPGLTGASVAFAFIQGNLFTFTVTYLTTELGYALAAAGVAFAVMQIAGMAGRVLMGWLSDRVGSAVRTLKVLAVAATATTFATSLISPEWPWLSVLAVLASTGLASTSWNGVFLAEVARISPPGKVGDATSGAVFFTFLSYTAGPAVFGFLVSLLGTYAPVIAGMAALGLAAGFALRAAERATGAR
jgi:MFS family permease